MTGYVHTIVFHSMFGRDVLVWLDYVATVMFVGLLTVHVVGVVLVWSRILSA